MLRDEPGQLVKIRIGRTRHARIPHRAPHDLAQHVAAAFVRRQHAVVNQKRRGPRVIRVDAQHGIGSRVALRKSRPISSPARSMIGLDQIRIVVREHALHHRRDALQTHAGIDRRPRQRRQLAVGIAIVLHEHQVPDLDEAPAGIIGKLCPAGSPLPAPKS